MKHIFYHTYALVLIVSFLTIKGFQDDAAWERETRRKAATSGNLDAIIEYAQKIRSGLDLSDGKPLDADTSKKILAAKEDLRVIAAKY
jgi:hypothetical protein